MTNTIQQARSHLRIVCRKSLRPRIDLTVATARPSLLDVRYGDPRLVVSKNGPVIYLGDLAVARIDATPIDQSALGRLLSQMRYRPPRSRPRRRIAGARQ